MIPDLPKTRIPIERVLVEREVCKDPRGCEILKGGHCPECVMDFVWGRKNQTDGKM